MPKPAISTSDLHPLIENRWSPLAFDGVPIEAREVRQILEAGRWAPSSFNEQPWRFSYGIAKTDAFQRILATLVPPNQVWAKHAGLLVIASTKTTFTLNGHNNRHAQYDTGAAVMQMALQAEALGIASHQMAGFSQDAAEQTLSVPRGFEALVAIAFGRPGDSRSLPADLQKREAAPRSRKPYRAIAANGRFPTAEESL